MNTKVAFYMLNKDLLEDLFCIAMLIFFYWKNIPVMLLWTKVKMYRDDTEVYQMNCFAGFQCLVVINTFE